jgi:hypothetical protein
LCEQGYPIEDLLLRAFRECQRKKIILPSGHGLSPDQSNVQKLRRIIWMSQEILADVRLHQLLKIVGGTNLEEPERCVPRTAKSTRCIADFGGEG